ncbi:MAG: right-handed parallel beta-helix repeat-containing protein [Acidobacteria bacterium]|nr:right-handed parallel beta-helix repeat-containing protein [Acidobacteriota bacterium]
MKRRSLPVFILSLIAVLCALPGATSQCLARTGLLPAIDNTLSIRVENERGESVPGFRWQIEQDNTNRTIPGALVWDSISVDIHRSQTTVVRNGRTAGHTVLVENVDLSQVYLVSVLPDGGHSIGAASTYPGQAEVVVRVHSYPIPTAQISILVHEDNNPINNVFDPDERGLANFTLMISDLGGQLSQDAFGNPLGTTYRQNPDGTFETDSEGSPVVEMVGSGIITTGSDGRVIVRYLAPGKYGIQAIPPSTEASRWVQTSTIEGTPTIDAWVKAREPRSFVEGFGNGFAHVSFGFVDPSVLPWNGNPRPGARAAIIGRVLYNHFDKPPFLQGGFAGTPVPDCWVGLNDLTTGIESTKGLIAVPCEEDGSFVIPYVPPGTYQLVTWDRPLDALFGFHTVTVPAEPGIVDVGDLLSFRWFGTYQGSVFFDTNANGFPDDGEPGMPGQALNIRFRDGTLYQSTQTDNMGMFEFKEVFPFFKWLVAEVDYARYKPTGMTAVVDFGGEIPPADGWNVPSFGVLNPQPQAEVNPNTGNNRSRTETGPVLTEGLMLFLNQTNIIHWGKQNWGPGENGGISGIVYYDTTRAENDPRYCAAEPWTPGISRVQVNLYADFDADDRIDDFDGDGLPTPADVDNFPFGWAEGGAIGPEDLDRNGDGIFSFGDAINMATTDSWDDNQPSGCVQNIPILHGYPSRDCYDNFGTWNQVRPATFDGGYMFASWYPGGLVSGNSESEGLPGGFYIVESVPPPYYQVVKEEDKNVDWGDTYTPWANKALALPPRPVGDPHLVPDELALFPGIPCYYAGETRPLCDRKSVQVTAGRNTAADFYLFTEVPKAARCVGFVNNDLSAEFDSTSPVYGEKSAPSWIPISFQDFTGREIVRAYTDEWGGYNALLPSTYTVNVASPSGVSPSMVTVVLNHPGPVPDPNHPGQMMLDPFYDPNYSVTPWTFQFYPGMTTYLDTPVVPVAGFAGYPKGGVDVEPPSGTPMIYSVSGPEGGAYVAAPGESLTILSVGTRKVPNPWYDPKTPGSAALEERDFSFGSVRGFVTVNGMAASVRSWSHDRIEISVPGTGDGGEVRVIRGDNYQATPFGSTVLIGPYPRGIHRVQAGESIQAAIDAALFGDLILVGPGVYDENVVLYKNVQLLGSGAESTVINGNPRPQEKLDAWHDKIDTVYRGSPNYDPNVFQAREAPTVILLGDVEHPFLNSPSVLLDGFTLTGSLSGGGVYVNNQCHYAVISHNKITGNQGYYGGGITVGVPGTGLDYANDNVVIRQNRILRNGGIFGGGGISLYEGSTGYRVEDNDLIGNFSQHEGGGILHYGLSDEGRIAHNRILFNEVFYGTVTGGDGGGLFLGGENLPNNVMTFGAGNVTVDANLIQGNLAGSGKGGGIRAARFNGQDVSASPSDPTRWYALNLFNNLIVNNVAGWGGGGIALQDAARVNILQDTVSGNDSVSVALNSFLAGSPYQSEPFAGGILSEAHSAGLATVSGATFSSPRLENSIIYRNRSFYYDIEAGGLVPGTSTEPVYWDLQVSGTTVPAFLDPRFCNLTSLTDFKADSHSYDNGTNLAGSPDFLSAYFNQLATAAVFDEGGNAVNVRFSPVTPTGNYHLRLKSPAINKGDPAILALSPDLSRDIDAEARPAPGTLSIWPDIGADEVLNPEIRIVTPNGGEIIPQGSMLTIRWTYTGASLYGVDLYLVGNRFQRRLTPYSLPVGVQGEGSFNWLVPLDLTPGSDYYLRATGLNTDELYVVDMSDAPFTIQ